MGAMRLIAVGKHGAIASMGAPTELHRRAASTMDSGICG